MALVVIKQNKNITISIKVILQKSYKNSRRSRRVGEEEIALHMRLIYNFFTALMGKILFYRHLISSCVELSVPNHICNHHQQTPNFCDHFYIHS